MRTALLVLVGVVLTLVAAAWWMQVEAPGSSGARRAPVTKPVDVSTDEAGLASSELALTPPVELPGRTLVTEALEAPSAFASRTGRGRRSTDAPKPPGTPAELRVRALGLDGESLLGVDITVVAPWALIQANPTSPKQPATTAEASKATSSASSDIASDSALHTASDTEDPPPSDAASFAEEMTSLTVRKGLLFAAFENLQPGVAFTVQISDELGGVLGGLEQAALEPGEIRFLDVPVASEVAPLSVKIVTRDGDPVAGALVVVQRQVATDGSELSVCQRDTNERGEALLGRFNAEAVTLLVSQLGVVMLRVPDVVAGGSDNPLTLVVDSMRRVTVRCVDDDGAPVAIDGASINGGWSMRPETDSAGTTWALSGVPAGTLAYAVTADKRNIKVRSAANDVVVHLHDRVPLTVSWNVADTYGGRCSLVAIRSQQITEGSSYFQSLHELTDTERLAGRLELAVPPGDCTIEMVVLLPDGSALAPSPTVTVDVRAGTPASAVLSLQ